MKARTAQVGPAGEQPSTWARDPFTEHEAINRVILLADEAGCQLHMMHADDYIKHGTFARFAPPRRFLAALQSITALHVLAETP